MPKESQNASATQNVWVHSTQRRGPGCGKNALHKKCAAAKTQATKNDLEEQHHRCLCVFACVCVMRAVEVRVETKKKRTRKENKTKTNEKQTRGKRKTGRKEKNRPKGIEKEERRSKRKEEKPSV